ncbi:MAG: ATP-binding protein [Alphaproteobacteria bacterium]|nr:ATP-binding protein [Alphaproteobacteria bacterium]
MSINPYTPGAAHAPPHLAGRDAERQEFSRLLQQTRILKNLLLTGIRGIGKTVLLREVLKEDARKGGWLWVGGGDISEGVSVSENNLANRVLTDLSKFSGDWEYDSRARQDAGFTGESAQESMRFDYETMLALFQREPGLTADKMKRVLLVAWALMQKHMPEKRGIIFAWDEAQNLADQKGDKQYPLGVLLDVFSSLQSQGVPFMLALTGLPTLSPKLVESRTYTERMFRVVTLNNLNADDSHQAIMKPLNGAPEWIKGFFQQVCEDLYRQTKGYPYFLQFWGRELYDYLVSNVGKPADERGQNVVRSITKKLDLDFFDGRWAKLTDRQRDLLRIIARLENSSGEFSVQEITNMSKKTEHAFSSSHINQMLVSLFNKGMVFKTRHGKYVLAVPLLDVYIRRRMGEDHVGND